MLKHRLLFGTLMTIFFIAIVIFDGWIDGSVTTSTADDKAVQGTILCVLISLLIIPAQLELKKLAAGKEIRILVPISIVASILFASSWYWPQLFEISLGKYSLLLSVLSLAGLFFVQYIQSGTTGVLTNCGASYFSIVYLGVFSAFVLGVRIEFGLWALLMFIFVVKFADIGAYVFGSLFGKHKFSPKISPGKTWEGMAGAVLFAVIVAICFAVSCDIMVWQLAVVFGICFAFIGQLGDLAESMIKRDTEQKDSSNNVPGFGGILDVIDSPLVAAPFAYLFFKYSFGIPILQ